MADRIQRSSPLLTNFESSTNQSLGYNHEKGISITTYMCRVVLQGHKTDRRHILAAHCCNGQLEDYEGLYESERDLIQKKKKEGRIIYKESYFTFFQCCIPCLSSAF